MHQTLLPQQQQQTTRRCLCFFFLEPQTARQQQRKKNRSYFSPTNGEGDGGGFPGRGGGGEGRGGEGRGGGANAVSFIYRVRQVFFFVFFAHNSPQLIPLKSVLGICGSRDRTSVRPSARGEKRQSLHRSPRLSEASR